MDGAYFRGYVRPANYADKRRDRRLAMNQTGKRQSLIILRERNGNSLPAVFKSEGAALAWARQRIQPGTVVNADEAASWDALNNRFEMRPSIIPSAIVTARLAPIRPKAISQGSVARKPVTIIISPVRIFFATRKRVHGVKMHGE